MGEASKTACVFPPPMPVPFQPTPSCYPCFWFAWRPPLPSLTRPTLNSPFSCPPSTSSPTPVAFPSPSCSTHLLLDRPLPCPPPPRHAIPSFSPRPSPRLPPSSPLPFPPSYSSLSHFFACLQFFSCFILRSFCSRLSSFHFDVTEPIHSVGGP